MEEIASGPEQLRQGGNQLLGRAHMPGAAAVGVGGLTRWTGCWTEPAQRCRAHRSTCQPVDAVGVVIATDRMAVVITTGSRAAFS